MIHLRSVSIQPDQGDSGFPFALPVVRSWGTLEFRSPVTIFVGENGSGKSTILEALAGAAGMVTAGAAPAASDASLKDVQRLGRAMRLAWNRRTQRGFFLRAEDFIGFIKGQVEMREEIEADLQRIEEDYATRSPYARSLARMASAGQLREMKQKYGDGLENRSHGEQFVEFFQARFTPGGLYLLDEPEAPLSPLRQLGFLSVMKAMLEKDAQFILATHSPILMAFPEAEIWSFDHNPIRKAAFDDLEHVRITRDFLNNPGSYLRHL